MAASTLLKNTVSIEKWMAAASLWNKETLYPEKNCSLRLSEVTYKEKYFFRNNYFGSHPFLMSFNFTEIFVHLSVIAAVCYFSVYKLIGWDPASIYLFNINSRNTRKRYEICPKFTINTIESCSDVFTFKCFYCWLWIGKCLLRSSSLCKCYYPNSKDKLAACFLNS